MKNRRKVYEPDTENRQPKALDEGALTSCLGHPTPMSALGLVRKQQASNEGFFSLYKAGMKDRCEETNYLQLI